MKSFLAAIVFVGIGSGVAQEVKPAAPNVAFLEPQMIQAKEVQAYGFESDPGPITSTVMSSSIPDVPKTMATAAALIRASGGSTTRPADFKRFRSDNFNRVLVANEFWARGLDAFSTVAKLNNPCRCYNEASRFFGVDMTPVFKSEAGAYSYSFGVATAYSFLSTKLWNASKNHSGHARFLRGLSRSLLIGDSSMEMAIGFHNLSLGQPGHPVQ